MNICLEKYFKRFVVGNLIYYLTFSNSFDKRYDKEVSTGHILFLYTKIMIMNISY